MTACCFACSRSASAEPIARSRKACSALRRRREAARDRARVARRGRARRPRLLEGRPRVRDRPALVRPLPRVRRRRARLMPDGRLQRARDHEARRVRARARASKSREPLPVPRALGRLAVLAEPTSICTRGVRHAMTIGGAPAVGAETGPRHRRRRRRPALDDVPPARGPRRVDGVARTVEPDRRRARRPLRLDEVDRPRGTSGRSTS